MSSCGGNCSCGSAEKCGNGCGCKMFPDISEGGTATQTLIVGGVPKTGFFDGEMEVGAENGCKCGGSCSCDPWSHANVANDSTPFQETLKQR